MSIRDFLNKQKKIIFISAFICWGLFVFNLVIAALIGMKSIFYFTIPFCFITGLFIQLSPYWLIKCPNCRKRIGFTFFISSSRIFLISDKLQFCPYCGVNLNTQGGPRESQEGRPESAGKSRQRVGGVSPPRGKG